MFVEYSIVGTTQGGKAINFQHQSRLYGRENLEQVLYPCVDHNFVQRGTELRILMADFTAVEFDHDGHPSIV